ncbi:hypothetical protein HMEPL2_35140 [Vreelandella aquamarina]|uniref:Tyr recombinase domain-containing protein n=2 Tax=Vreelandella aquamarina TaxID=77097 RepID=A0A6F8XH46_9GAMM|nr:hypothetical protein HMEPL2_35140 [Halomonas meridiana]
MEVFQHLSGSMLLMASLMYGSGLRVSETCRLRVKDIDFSRQIITVYAGKGNKDRTTLQPPSCVQPLHTHIQMAEQQLNARLEANATPVSLPYALDRKYPNAGISLAWQWLFPSSRPCFDDPLGLASMRGGASFYITFMPLPSKKPSNMPCAHLL